MNVFDGQLYVSEQNNSTILVGTVGTGTPTTSGQTTTPLPGFVDPGGKPESFFLADLDGRPGVDTLYVADEAAGIQKWSLVDGRWGLTSVTPLPSDVLYGVTGVVSGTRVTLYATGSGSANDTGTLYSLTDTSGFDGAIGAPLLTTATVALPGRETFRGVAPTPTPAPETPGHVPPDAHTRRCEDAVAAHLVRLSSCLTTCGSGRGCRPGAAEPGACRARYDRTAARRLGTRRTTCPACLDAATQSDLAGATTGFLVEQRGRIQCTGAVPSANASRPTARIAKCESAVARHLATLARCAVGCRTRQADAAWEGERPFDATACESRAGRPASCRAAFDAATRVLARTPVCPPCLDQPAQESLADSLMEFVDRTAVRVYCAGTSVLPSLRR